MNITVYAVEAFTPYEGRETIRLFAREESAREFASRCQNFYETEDRSVAEHPAGAEFSGASEYRVKPYEVTP